MSRDRSTISVNFDPKRYNMDDIIRTISFMVTITVEYVSSAHGFGKIECSACTYSDLCMHREGMVSSLYSVLQEIWVSGLMTKERPIGDSLYSGGAGQN